MTRMTPRRRMILQSSQIRFREARTFMSPVSFLPVRDLEGPA